MKVALIGNCQMTSLGRCLNAAVDTLDIEILHGSARFDRLDRADLLVVQPFVREGHFGENVARLVARHPRVATVPNIAFNGFQPDCIVPTLKGAGIAGPLGVCHSAIACAAHAEGLPLDRALWLYNAYSYARLGYFAAYDSAKSYAAEHFATVGYDPALLFGRSDVFMHSPNHPVLAVIRDLATMLLEREGIAFDREAAESDDPLTMVGWPVYPEIAERLGVAPTFTYRNAAGEMDRLQFVAASYACYDALDDFDPNPTLDRARTFIRREVLGQVDARAATPDDVRSAYRLLLGRKCETDAIAEAHAAQAGTLDRLRANILASEEFAAFAAFDGVRAKAPCAR